MYFLEFEGLQKFIPQKFVNKAIRESWSPQNLILKVGVGESLYPRKFQPAKLCTLNVVNLIRRQHFPWLDQLALVGVIL